MQRLHEYHGDRSGSLNLHTYRMITASPAAPITRIFLVHNGLNELDRLGFYHDLASYLIADNPDVACILRPFPGHLTRAPYDAVYYAETPLQRYLWDGSHLFQQFVRYMVETRWFLSALCRPSQYGSCTGTGLLGQGDDQAAADLSVQDLARAMRGEFESMNVASIEALSKIPEDQGNVRSPEPVPDAEVFEETIRSLRRAFHPPGDNHAAERPEPSLHAVGYSIGGFAAQSVFMSWPSLVASCSTLLSGGALRELTPTAFADPEEWQTVLHSLRYELDDWMLRCEHDGQHGEIAGMPPVLFRSFQRTFYEVFQQEYRGSHRTRLAAFRRRMLFIVGGDDPVVRPQSVLESGPPGGSNLVQIGGLGHFLGSKPKGDEEDEQRRFWLPEVGKLIYRFSREADEQQLVTRNDLLMDAAPLAAGTASAGHRNGMPKRLREQDILDLPQEGALSAELFGGFLDDTLARLDDEHLSRLIICRNELPEVMLDEPTVYDRARAFHYDDMSIASYRRSTARRHDALMKHASQAVVILPWNAKRLVEYLDPWHGFPSQSETAAGYKSSPMRAGVWPAFLRTLTDFEQQVRAGGAGRDAVKVFDGRKDLRLNNGMSSAAKALILQQRESAPDHKLSVPSLPDCWIWLAPSFFGLGEGAMPTSAAMATEQFIKRIMSLHTTSSGEPSQDGDQPLNISAALRDNEIRVITISRARYNPRYRGRLVVNPNAVKQILTHVALCLASARSLRKWREQESDWFVKVADWRQ
jgi:hypothetical protein